MKKFHQFICLFMSAALCVSLCSCGETPMTIENCDNGHDLVQVGYTAPTCQTIGAKVYICSRCGYTETETLFPIEHNFVVKSTTPSTCTEKGSKLLECTMCHTPKTEEIPCCDHKYEHQTIAPTCFTDGEDFDECTMCGSRIDLVATPKYLHRFPSTAATDYSRCELCGVGSALYKVVKIQGYLYKTPISNHNYRYYVVTMDIDRPDVEYPVSIPDTIPNPTNYHVVVGQKMDSFHQSFQAKRLVCENGLPKMKDGWSYAMFPDYDYNYLATNNDEYSVDNYTHSILFNAQRDPNTLEPFTCDYPTTISIVFTPDICDWIEV